MANRTYSHSDYENALYAHNVYTRTHLWGIPEELWCIAHTIDTGYDHCYDCASEIFLIWEYVKLTLIHKTEPQLYWDENGLPRSTPEESSDHKDGRTSPDGSLETPGLHEDIGYVDWPERWGDSVRS